MVLVSQAVHWTGPHIATEVLRIFCIVIGVAVLAMAWPVGRRYWHPIFLAPFLFMVLWDVSSTFTEIGRLGTPMTWRIWFNTSAEVFALGWEIFLMWRWKRYGKIDYGRVRNYYRGLLQGHDPSSEGASDA